MNYDQSLPSEFRKQEGIFYTPVFLAKAMVFELLESWFSEKEKEVLTEKTDFGLAYFHKILTIKFLDPACGTGDFLKPAFEILCKKLKQILLQINDYQAFSYDYENHLLENCLFGVDIDEQAVEICRKTLKIKHIRVGNSLISDPKIDAKAFVWEKEFSEVFAAGGFDRVVANPPYVAKTKDSIYKDYDWNTDLYLMFYERSFQKLLKNNGILSFITPRFWLVNRNCADFRKFMLTQIDLYSLTETSPFEDVNTECVIAVLKKQVSKQDKIEVFIEKNKKYFFLNQISKSYALKNTACEILTSLKKEDVILLEKIDENTVHLSEISESKRGAEIGKADLRKPKGKICLIGQDTHKYQIVFEKTHISTKHKEYKRLETFFNRKNLVYLRRVGKQLTASVSNLAYAFNKNIYGIAIDLDFDKHYILALLNSKLLDYYYKTKFSMKKIDIFPEIQSYLFEALPIKKQADQQIFIDLVSQILSLKSQQKDSFALENQVDDLVYKLYDLTEEEIQFIENQ